MSTACEYDGQLRSSSGARYQRVTTYSVKKSSRPSSPSGGVAPALASPKSQMQRSQLALTRRLEGLMSRCMTSAECTYLRARRTWYRKNDTWSSDSGCDERKMRCRSVSMSSYTRKTSSPVHSTSRSGATLSCRRWRMSAISRSVRRASMALEKTFDTFLTATRSPESSSRAATTTPYAPVPICFSGVYRESTSTSAASAALAVALPQSGTGRRARLDGGLELPGGRGRPGGRGGRLCWLSGGDDRCCGMVCR
mmetsp:Transcript_144/g.586  ORF Transcript_144/g.586 Transcript_144/m.586 type:complete len:253 (+) Transcript_144:1308-2066(+)